MSADSALRMARTSRNWTLEEAAERLNRITGGAADASLLSAWESGRRRTGLRNRDGLCRLYHQSTRVLFAHQDGARQTLLESSGTSVVVRVLTRYTDLVEAMIEVASGAREQLVVTGSRSREKAYLSAIEETVARHRDLVHYRVLYGPPRHQVLVDHLLRLLQLRDPTERRNGVRTLHVGLAQPLEAMERSFVASERAAVVPLPSFHGADGFDCGVLLAGEAAVGLVHHGREASAAARAVESAQAVLAMQMGRAPARGEENDEQ